MEIHYTYSWDLFAIENVLGLNVSNGTTDTDASAPCDDIKFVLTVFLCGGSVLSMPMQKIWCKIRKVL